MGTNHLINVLDGLFQVEISTEISGEVRRHKAELGDHEHLIMSYLLRTRKRFYRQQDYERILFNHFSPGGNPTRNRGERFNCCLAIYRVRKQVDNQVIMLTDDTHALNGLIKWNSERFKVAITWNSLDLLIHLYLVQYPKWPFAQALVALRSVNSRIGGNQPEVMNRFLRSRRYLQELHNMLDIMPHIRGVS